MMPGAGRGWLCLWRALLRLYPARFRAAYGHDMLRVAGARCRRARETRGRAAAFACAVRVTLDITWTAALERLHGRAPDPGTPPANGDTMILHLAANLRSAARSLRRQPGFAATIVLMLAVGTGATLSLFTIADAALLRPLPYPDAGRLFTIAQRDARFGLTPFAPPYLRDLRERTGSFDALAGFSPSWAMTLTEAGEPRTIAAAYVSDGLLELLGAHPVRGRLFLPGEHAAGGSGVAIVAESFWAQTFGDGTPLAGQRLQLDGATYDIVGILPSAFRLPIKDSAVSQGRPSASVWVPFARNPYVDLRMVPVMNVVGRLRPGVDRAAADAEIQRVGRTLVRDYPEHSRWVDTTAVPLGELVTADARRTIWPLFGAAALLLLIACANVANLLLARGAARRHEIAVRTSLGATRRRIVAQLLTESLVLAAIGCALGLALAGWVLTALPALGLQGLPPSAEIRLDARVVLFTIVLAAVTALAFGLVPALRASSAAGGEVLKSGTRIAGGGVRLRRGLVAAQTALALSLLTGAGLLARSFVELTRVDPGFHADGVLVVPLDLGRRDPPGRRVFLDQLAERLAGLPGVTAVSAVNRAPFSGSNVLVGVELEGDPVTAREPVPMDRRVVAAGYFDALGIPLEAGRDFGAADHPGADGTAIVSRAAARFWPEGRALGQRLRLMLQSGPGPWLTVVGVSGDILHEGLDRASRPEVYVPYAQASVASMVMLVRAAGDPSGLAAAAKTQVWALDPEVPLDGVRPLDRALAESVGEPRLRMLLLNAFAALALLLAALGIYGVTAYTVALRTRDIGVRMALGAARSDVLRLVLGDGLRPAIWGGVVGLAASLGLTRALAGLLFGIGPFDPLAYAVAATVLMLAALLAAYVPARRASRIDPVIALRMD